jgi:demethylmenaquinone methyltransferase/2-methoxy-6-polyprenyl-1,4-benzoquinol methylase
MLEILEESPNSRLAQVKYCHQAGAYDYVTAAAQPLRYMATSLLGRRSGEVILDVGCGTGLNFAAIEARVGCGGRIVGIDSSPDMLAKAHERIQRHGWDNISLMESGVETARIPAPVDSALFCLVHDIMRSPAALGHVLDHVRPGGQVVAAGAKLVPGWLWWAPLLNHVVLAVNRPFITSLEGMEQPWSHLAGLLPDLVVQVDPWGASYVASGTKPG